MLDSLLDQVTPTLRGFDTVRVQKSDLEKIIKKNRSEHREIFEEAIENWHKQVQERLAILVSQAKKGPDAVELHIGLPRPDDHTNDYDRVLKMLELSQDDEFELSQHEFSQFVMDDFGWQGTFLATSSNYSSLAIEKARRISG